MSPILQRGSSISITAPLSSPLHRGSSISIAAILHRGSSISITRHWEGFCTQSVLHRTEVRLTLAAGRGLLNIAHFVLALIQIRHPQLAEDVPIALRGS